MTSALVKDSVDSFRKASVYDAVVWTKCAFEACRGFSSTSRKIFNRKGFRPVKDLIAVASKALLHLWGPGLRQSILHRRCRMEPFRWKVLVIRKDLSVVPVPNEEVFVVQSIRLASAYI